MENKKIDIPEGVHWLEDADYQKAVSQLRMQFSGVFKPLRLYGQGVFVDGAIEECVKLAEDFGLRVRGINKAISLELIRRKNGRFVD